jgi:pimeloyl-ACP methyl ester carboxylesterase
MVSAILLTTGAFLSRKIEPGVTVSQVTIARDTPALRFMPDALGPHPVALLAHGVFCNKEMLFCYGEALAHAGFECYSVDLPGHGQSPHRFGGEALGTSLTEATGVVGPVDVFIGHSMGAYAGALAETEHGFHPRLFIAIGALPNLDKDAPPLLLMSGELDEFVRPSWVRARTDARIEIFPHCNHLSELYDRRLVNSAVAAACATVGKTPPSASTSWRCRVIGMFLGWLDTIGLAKVVLQVAWSARWRRFRAPLFSIALIFGSALVTQPWIGAMPHLQRLPWFLVPGLLLWLSATGLRRLKIPRWSLLALTMVCLVAGAIIQFGAILLLGALCFFALMVGTVCGAIAARRGTPGDGDISFAITAGYVIGQWIVKFL